MVFDAQWTAGAAPTDGAAIQVVGVRARRGLESANVGIGEGDPSGDDSRAAPAPRAAQAVALREVRALAGR